MHIQITSIQKTPATGYEQDDIDKDIEIDDDYIRYNEEHKVEPCQKLTTLEVDDRKRREALFILKIKEEQMLTQTALNYNALLIDIKGSYRTYEQMLKL